MKTGAATLPPLRAPKVLDQLRERIRYASTHKQALSALLFFYGKVLGNDLPWMADIGRRHAHLAPT